MTDAIVTHWFQNKRKMTKNQRGSSFDSLIPSIICFSSAVIPEDSLPSNISTNHNNPDYENTSGEDEGHHQHHPTLSQQQQKSNISMIDVDSYDTSLLDPQLAAYRAIMSRMVPFRNNINGNNLSRHFVKQEPNFHPDESSREDVSISQSPSNDHSSP